MKTFLLAALLVLAACAPLPACGLPPAFEPIPNADPPAPPRLFHAVLSDPAPAAASVAPQVVLLQPAAERAQATIDTWVKVVLGIIGGLVAIVVAAATAVATVRPQLAALAAQLASIVEEFRGRLDRQAAKQGSLQEQVTATALAVTPATSVPTVPSTKPPEPRPSPYLCGSCKAELPYPMVSNICPACGGNASANRGPLDNPDFKKRWDAIRNADKPAPDAELPRNPAGPTLTTLGLALAAGALLLLPACSTTTPSPVVNARNAGLNAAGKAALADAAQFLGTVGTQMLFAAAKAEATGGAADFQHAAAAGLYAQVNSQTVAAVVEDVVRSFSAGKAMKTAEAAANAAAFAGSPAGGEHDGVAITRAIAAVISTAAGAPPAR